MFVKNCYIPCVQEKILRFNICTPREVLGNDDFHSVLEMIISPYCKNEIMLGTKE